MTFLLAIDTGDDHDPKSRYETSALALGLLRDAMQGFGMLTGDQLPLPSCSRQALDYSTAPDRPGPAAGGIPIDKLTRSGGQLITAAEIAAALAAYEAAPEPLRAIAEDPASGPHGWPSWIAFLRRGAEHAGIRVS
ncbi:hypothetical protein [Kitasatospora cheerisanensis]|uniref:Uncharacterized protein n=1 Tax=Kitasatospora cheerisanensis KCTC 2395 TaxID=1348663 RepID=A0A066YWY6_9ACTN|nr:hypothetical protein [Kitasatospora cheerisanensis]KDN85712.1 hypothetical protein KCH_25400 [Kitasatospora cheerisanensis KCTC 2395]